MMEHPDIAEAASQLVAVYDTEAEADAAKRVLVAAGVNPSAIEVFRAVPAEAAGPETVDPIVNKSFWGRLRELLAIAPPHELTALEEGLTRGHALLTVSPPARERDRIVALLDGTSPIDFNAKQQQWRDSGWQPTDGGLRGHNPPDLTVASGNGGRVRSYQAGDPGI